MNKERSSRGTDIETQRLTSGGGRRGAARAQLQGEGQQQQGSAAIPPHGGQGRAGQRRGREGRGG